MPGEQYLGALSHLPVIDLPGIKNRCLGIEASEVFALARTLIPPAGSYGLGAL